MEKEQRKFYVTFYLSDGKEVNGVITHHDEPEAYLKAIQILMEAGKPILIEKIGTVIQSKYITHVKIVEGVS